jgi:hypothetical protein
MYIRKSAASRSALKFNKPISRFLMSRDNPLAAQAVGSPAAAFRSFPNHDKTTRHYIRDGRFFAFKRVRLILSLARPSLFRRRHVETRIISWVDVVDAPRSCRIDLHDRVFIDEDVMSNSRRH